MPRTSCFRPNSKANRAGAHVLHQVPPISFACLFKIKSQIPPPDVARMATLLGRRHLLFPHLLLDISFPTFPLFSLLFNHFISKTNPPQPFPFQDISSPGFLGQSIFTIYSPDSFLLRHLLFSPFAFLTKPLFPFAI